LLAAIADVNGDGVSEIATYGRDAQVTGENRFYLLSGNQPQGTIVNGDAAAIYSLPFGGVQPRYASPKPNSGEFLLSEFQDTVRRRDAASASIWQTVTGPGISNGGIWIGDVDGDTVSDYLTGARGYPRTDPLYVISGADMVDGTAQSRAILTLSDPSTPGLGYAEDNNSIAARLGDINGDGRAEIAVGSSLYRIDANGMNYGRVVVFDGATGAKLYSIEPDQSHQNGVYFANNIVASGDMDADGVGDMIVSARGFSATPGGFGDGAIIGYSGVDGSELFRHYGNAETLGDYEIALIGDINGDGAPDLAVASTIQASIWLSKLTPVAAWYSCMGFDAPMDSGPVTVKGNRAIPLKAILRDGNGIAVNALASPPVLSVFYSAGAQGAVDVTGESLSVGLGDEGNRFVFEDGQWRYNLKTSGFSAKGTYTVRLTSGNQDTYFVMPVCEGKFVRQ
jgi:hypothetical protein